MCSLESFRGVRHDRDTGRLNLTAQSEVCCQTFEASESINCVHKLPSHLPGFKIFEARYSFFPMFVFHS